MTTEKLTELFNRMSQEEFIKEALVISSFIIDSIHPNFHELSNDEKTQKIDEFLILYRKILLGIHGIQKEKVIIELCEE